jgi:saccharopine dehydrogenase-like NADP-dependent oxidoreductase
VRALIEWQLVEESPVEIDGVNISPRKFLLKIINPLLVPQEGDGDVCVMYNTVTGTKDKMPHKVEYLMWETADEQFSAMARVTSFPAAIGAKLVRLGRVDLKGIRAPECILGENYQWFLDELRKEEYLNQEDIAGWRECQPGRICLTRNISPD